MRISICSSRVVRLKWLEIVINHRIHFGPRGGMGLGTTLHGQSSSSPIRTRLVLREIEAPKTKSAKTRKAINNVKFIGDK
ncbi:hypothetical protein CHS0354_039941, partial [Potamilus streckersoni]